MKDANSEIRKYDRYASAEDMTFHYCYDFVARMELQDSHKRAEVDAKKRYSAVSKNVSAEGLCFTSDRQFQKGDILELEVYLPRSEEPVHLKGEVKWSKESGSTLKTIFDTGIKLIAVEGQVIHDTIYYDETHHVIWSSALESILGKFRLLVQKKPDGDPSE